MRVLGYINATALWQLVVAHAPDATIDVAGFQVKRDLLCDALKRMGYEASRPQGSFYVFSKTPIADDLASSASFRTKAPWQCPVPGSDLAGTCGLR